MVKKLEIIDTTLRDGEQMKNVSYSPEEKLALTKILLDDVNVDKIEITSARVSEGEEEAVQKIIQWANEKNYSERIEILGFVDIKKSVDWIANSGGRVNNILAKGSEKHLQTQLKKSKEQHIEDIKNTVTYAGKRGVMCNLWLEDWSNGMINSPEYVYYLIDCLREENIKRFMLPDTDRKSVV